MILANLANFCAKELASELSDAAPGLKLNLWYLDNGHLVGKISGFVPRLDIISSELGNPSKFVVYGINIEDFPCYTKRLRDRLIVGFRNSLQSRVFPLRQQKVRGTATEAASAEMLLKICQNDILKEKLIGEQVKEFDSAIDRTIRQILGHIF